MFGFGTVQRLSKVAKRGSVRIGLRGTAQLAAGDHAGEHGPSHRVVSVLRLNFWKNS